MKNLILVPNKGQNTFVRPSPDYVNAAVLAANVSELQAVPSGAFFVLFSSDGDFYAQPNSGASVPAADITNGSSSELNPSAWYLGTGVTGIGVIAELTRKVTFSYYQ